MEEDIPAHETLETYAGDPFIIKNRPSQDQHP